MSDTEALAPDAAAEARRNVYARVPFTRMLGVRREFSAEGRARLVVDEREDLTNPIGALHGGLVLTLLDVVMASAAVSRHDFQCTAVTLNLNTSFLRPGHGCLIADGEWLSEADGVATCRATARDASGETVASALGAFRLLPLSATRVA